VNYVLGSLYNRKAAVTYPLLKLICNAVNSGDDIPDQVGKPRYLQARRVFSSIKNNAIKDTSVPTVFSQFELSPVDISVVWTVWTKAGMEIKLIPATSAPIRAA